MGCVWNILSPADSKSQRFPISAQKAGRTTFVVSFSWLPGQCKNYQQNSFLAPSPVELCMGCVWNILSPADSKSQRFPISAQKAGRTTFVVAGYRGSLPELLSGTFPWSCAWGVFGTFCHQPTPKVSDCPSQPRKQVEPLLWCLSAGYRGSVRTTNRTPFWHLPRGVVHGVCLEHFVTSRLQKSAIPHLSPESR